MRIQHIVIAVATLALVLTDPSIAHAHIVYFKDGTVVRGQVTVREQVVSIRGENTELSFPMDSVRAISLTDEPIVAEQKPLESARALNNDWLIWSLVLANVVSVVVSGVKLYQGITTPARVAP